MIKIGKSLRCYKCEYPRDEYCEPIVNQSSRHLSTCPTEESECYTIIKHSNYEN
jgi:hypothetical protein